MQRKTRQRAAIQQALTAADRPLSPREILDLAAAAQAGINLATVYRTLRELLTECWIIKVELPGEAARYERAGKAHHHHFHCRRCDRVFELDGCGLSGAGPLPSGFVVEGHEVTIWGLCAGCHQRSAP